MSYVEKLKAVREELTSRFGTAAMSRINGMIAGLLGEVKSRAPELQKPERFLVPGLTAQPWHDARKFEWCGIVEANSVSIRSELEQLLADRAEFSPYADVGSLPSRQKKFGVVRESWTIFDLNVAEGRRLCPKTSAILQDATRPELGEPFGACFSQLKPGATLPPHCGATNTRLTTHLGLVVPERCSITVGNEERTWQEGVCVVFDDSFEHHATNASGSSRIILLFQVWHPELSLSEIEALTALANAFSVKS